MNKKMFLVCESEIDTFDMNYKLDVDIVMREILFIMLINLLCAVRNLNSKKMKKFLYSI